MEKDYAILNLLDVIYEKIISSLDSIKNNGLLEGRMGIVLFLYKYARIKNSEKIEEKAGDIIDDIWESVHMEKPSSSFYNGDSGIAWGLFWLGKNGFLEIDNTLNSYTESVDINIFRVQEIKIPVQIDIESGLFASGIYLSSRCNLPDKNLLEKYYLQEMSIYLIEECERILYKKTSCNNIYLPDLTLNLLNSILYFLVYVHKLRIYPHKTSMLIEYSFIQILEMIKHSNVHEIITLKCLLSSINDNMTFHNIINTNIINDYIYKSMKEIKCSLDILSESGIYSLLYDNKFIFEETYSHTILNNPQYINLLCNKLIEDEKIPLKKILGIGHGLLTMFHEK